MFFYICFTFGCFVTNLTVISVTSWKLVLVLSRLNADVTLDWKSFHFKQNFSLIFKTDNICQSKCFLSLFLFKLYLHVKKGDCASELYCYGSITHDYSNYNNYIYVANESSTRMKQPVQLNF